MGDKIGETSSGTMSLELAGVSIFVAFLAGLLSVASPCVLPLIPAYLGYLTDASLENATSPGQGKTRPADDRAQPDPPIGEVGMASSAVVPTTTTSTQSSSTTILSSAIATTSVAPSPFLHSLSFVSGFSLVFVTFGISLGIVGFFLRDQQDIILKVAGSLLIVLGLHLAKVITIPWMQQERRIDVGVGQRISYTRSFLVGSAFSAGWSPCIGPTLGAILALAVASGTVAQAGILLAAYSLGLAVPFLSMGLAFHSVRPLYIRIKRYTGIVNYISGALLIVIGILIFTDSLINLNSLFNFGFLENLAAES